MPGTHTGGYAWYQYGRSRLVYISTINDMGVRIFPNRHVIYSSRSYNLGWSTWFCSDDFSRSFLFDLYLTKQNVSYIIDVYLLTIQQGVEWKDDRSKIG